MIFLELKDKHGIDFIVNVSEIETVAKLPYSSGCVLHLKSQRQIEIQDDYKQTRDTIHEIIVNSNSR